ncbi:hypothetical protein HYU40_02460 [Candidatus Woesearchaeota archaeon]|nr:hypothetical protein [Candidatus Woesearchaeota archaeon]
MNFWKWFIQNPKIRMKYGRLINAKGNYNDSLLKIKSKLKSGDYEFSDGVIEHDNKLLFEFKDTRLGYQIKFYPLKENSHHIKISTIFYTLFPFRELTTINDIKKDFYRLCELIRTLIKMQGNENETIFLEVGVKNKNSIRSSFDYKDVHVTFLDEKIQIDNTYGSEFDQIILLILTRWLIDRN